MLFRRYLSRNIVQPIDSIITIKSRTFKNFGHKREPIPMVTTLWHGFLTFTFIGLGLQWDKFAKFFFGETNYDQILQDSLAGKDDGCSRSS